MQGRVINRGIKNNLSKKLIHNIILYFEEKSCQIVRFFSFFLKLRVKDQKKNKHNWKVRYKNDKSKNAERKVAKGPYPMRNMDK